MHTGTEALPQLAGMVRILALEREQGYADAIELLLKSGASAKIGSKPRFREEGDVTYSKCMLEFLCTCWS
jgi:hypothetical protein